LTGCPTAFVKLKRVSPVALFPAAREKSFPPMLLDLSGNTFEEGHAGKFCFQTCLLNLDWILHPGEKAFWPCAVNGITVRTPPPLHPETKSKANEIS